MLLCPFHPFFRKSDLLLVDSAVLEFQILKQKKNSGSTFSSCVSFHYKRSDSLFQTVSSPVFLSGSRYSVGLFNIPYTIFTMCLATQINAGAYSCLPPAFSGNIPGIPHSSAFRWALPAPSGLQENKRWPVISGFPVLGTHPSLFLLRKN